MNLNKHVFEHHKVVLNCDPRSPPGPSPLPQRGRVGWGKRSLTGGHSQAAGICPLASLHNLLCWSTGCHASQPDTTLLRSPTPLPPAPLGQGAGGQLVDECQQVLGIALLYGDECLSRTCWARAKSPHPAQVFPPLPQRGRGEGLKKRSALHKCGFQPHFHFV